MESQSLSVVIIDDEQSAIDLLDIYLRQFPVFNVVAKETGAARGLDSVINLLPDLVFLDIDMPDMDGLQVADQIHSENFCSEIVFMTAHDHYAFDAMGVEPLDFLTKPFGIQDVETVLQKYHLKVEKKNRERKLDNFIHSQPDLAKISVPANHGLLMISIRDIVLVRSNVNKSLLYLQDGTIEEVAKGLTAMMEQINSPAFFQIHRTTFINLNYLQRLNKKKSVCILQFHSTVLEEPISKFHLAQFEKLNSHPYIKFK
jgi:two-component system LytT family response regulator